MTEYTEQAQMVDALRHCGQSGNCKTCPFNGGKELPTQDDCFGCTVQWLYEEVGK